MYVYLTPNPNKDREFRVTGKAAALLEQFGQTALVSERFADAPSLIGKCTFLPEAAAIERADVVITIGGDGTLLNTAHGCIAARKPLFGVNLGRTGFLATCEVSQLEDKLCRLSREEYSIEHRLLLCAEVPGRNWRGFAVNDVVAFDRSRLHPMDYTITCDGVFVSRYRSDGMIVATPTGSTAYSLSAGGSVLDTRAEVMALTPICAHSIHAVPLIFSAGRRLTLTAEKKNREMVQVSVDSQEGCVLAPGESLHVTTAADRLALVTFDTAEQFRAIEEKLMRR